MSVEEYAVGDLIEAVNGEERISTRVVKHPEDGTLHVNPLNLSNPDRWTYVSHFASSGFTVTVIEKAKPPLPTEFGHYADRLGDVWKLSEGGWFWANRQRDVEDVERWAPFTRFSPVAETLGKVRAQFVLASYATDGPAVGMIDAIAADYGVTL